MAIYRVYTLGRGSSTTMTTFKGFLEFLTACQDNAEAGFPEWAVEHWEVVSSVHWIEGARE